MATYDTKRLTEASDIAALVDEWNELAGVCSAQPFALPAFGLTWHEHFGRGDLVVITVRNGSGRLDGVVAVDRRRKGVVEVLEPLGQDLGAVTDFLVRPGTESVAEELWNNLLGERQRSIYITDFVVGRPGLSSLRHGNSRWTAMLSDECPVIDLRGLDSAQEHLALPQRSGLRKKMRKAERLIGSRHFTTTFESDPAKIPEMLDRVLPLYDRSHRVSPKLHLDRGKYRSFYRSSMSRLAEANQLTIAVAELDGEPVAFDVYVVAGTTASAILGRFDPEQGEISPGQLLTGAGIDWGIEQGLERLDLQLGGSLYKRRWATGAYDTVRVLASDPSTFVRADAGIRALGQIRSGVDRSLTSFEALKNRTGQMYRSR